MGRETDRRTERGGREREREGGERETHTKKLLSQ